MHRVLSQVFQSKGAVYVLFTIAVLPILILRDFTPDNELRYLSIADEALRNGSLFAFTNHGIPYADKPPLYLWIVMLGKYLFGKHCMLFLGVFSIVPALVVLRVMDRWVAHLLDRSSRLMAQLMLFTSGYFLGAAVVIRMDMLMCMFIVLALYTFYKMFSGQSRKCDRLLFSLYVFLALFSKGPIGLLIPLVSTVIFLLVKKKIRTIGRYWGWLSLLVLFALSGIWFVGVYIDGGKDYLDNLLFNQTINRAVNSFHHKEPVWYYLKVIWYSLAPWAFLYVGVLLIGLKRRLVSTDVERFFLVVALSTFVMLSLLSSKLEIYMLPAFPFFCYICVLWIVKLPLQRWMLLLVGIPSTLLAFALPGLVVCIYRGVAAEYAGFPFVVGTSILTVVGIVALVLLVRRRLHHAVVVVGAGMLMAIFSASFALPSLNSTIGKGELCRQAKTEAAKQGIVRYYSFHISRVENVDVYLDAVPVALTDDDLTSPSNRVQRPAILLVRGKDVDKNASLRGLIGTREIHHVGNCCYIVL